MEGQLDLPRQLGYFSYCLRHLPSPYCKLDTNRLTLVHFAVHALDLLGVPWRDDDRSAKAKLEALKIDKDQIINWIYALQVPRRVGYETFAGFRGGTFLGGSFSDTVENQPWEFNHGHIAMTYTALCTLRCLGDDWSRVDKSAIIGALQNLQRADGSYRCVAVGSEHDMRFLYCAAAISYMLQDWNGIDVERAIQYIKNCRAFDGALGLGPGQEGHGGSTFTAVATLVLLNKLDAVIDADWRRELIYWCTARQVGGMQGRPNKAEDTCYSYWIGGTLRLLQADHLLDHDRLCAFVFECQTKLGGFGKVVGTHPDILHSYYSLAYLSLSQDQQQQPAEQAEQQQNGKLKRLNCTLGFGKEAAGVFESPIP